MEEDLAKLLTRFEDFSKKLLPFVKRTASQLLKRVPAVAVGLAAVEALIRLFTDLSAEIEKGVKPVTDAVKAFHQSFLNSFASDKDLKANLAKVDKDLQLKSKQKGFDEAFTGPGGEPLTPQKDRLQTQLDLEVLEREKAELLARLEEIQARGEELSATSAALIETLKQLEAAIGGEEGLLAAFLELDAALQSANLPAELENLADAVATAAARIANTPGGTTNGKASGGTVQPGQPVLVGERGPEIFVPSSAGAIVNAFDASADPSVLGAAGSAGSSARIVVALQDLEATISELDETIQEAESAGLIGLGASGDSRRGRRLRGGGGGASGLDEVENFLDTVESTVGAFENISRTLDQFKTQAENDFGDISAAGQEAFQSILGSIQSLVSDLFGGKAGRIAGTIASFAKIFGFGFAGGGDLQPGVPAIVGERGPEVIVPRVPLSVKNNADSRRIFGGGTPIMVNQTVNMSADVKNTIRAEVFSAMPIAARLATQAVTAQLQGRRF